MRNSTIEFVLHRGHLKGEGSTSKLQLLLPRTLQHTRFGVLDALLLGSYGAWGDGVLLEKRTPSCYIRRKMVRQRLTIREKQRVAPIDQVTNEVNCTTVEDVSLCIVPVEDVREFVALFFLKVSMCKAINQS